MSIRNRAILAILASLLCSSDTDADGVWNRGVTGTVWSDGINNSAAMGGGGAATPCSGTGLNFSVACNSQYIGII